MARVAPILNELYQLSLQLRKTKRKYRFAKYQNKVSENAAATQGSKMERVKKYKKEGGLFKVRKLEYDAEEYYRARIEARTRDIKDLKKDQMR
jgi:hypothetical protein